MKNPSPLTALILILYVVPAAYSQKAANGNPTPAPTPEPITYKELLELQDKRHAQDLQTHKEVADRAIQVVSTQAQNLLLMLEGGILLVAVLTAGGGWWAKRKIDHFTALRKQSEEFLSASKARLLEIEEFLSGIKTRLAEVEEAQNRFNLRIDALIPRIMPLESQAQQFESKFSQLGTKVDLFDTELLRCQDLIDDIKLKARLNHIGVWLRSDIPSERLIAAQKASEIAQGEGGAVAVPYLLDCITPPLADPPVMQEALFGLAYRAKDIIKDARAIGAILAALGFHDKTVRRQALETIRKMGLVSLVVRERVQHCYESDEDSEVRELAGQILGENGIES